MEQLISKKELLEEMGITYGQLYRWKRKKILPEEWFIKKSSFTGQETFFPKEKVLKRIVLIKELKNKYSLDELANFFKTGQEKNHSVHKEDLALSQVFLPTTIEFLDKESYEYAELLQLAVIDQVTRQYETEREQKVRLKEMLNQCDIIKFNYKLLRIREENSFFVIQQENAIVLFDPRMTAEEIYNTYLAKDKVNEIYEYIGELKE